MSNTFTNKETNNKLENIYNKFKTNHYHLNNIFESSPDRAQKFSINTNNIFLDYSKNWLTDESLNLLFNLADECRLSEKIEAMYNGCKINLTENREVLHTALRNLERTDFVVNDINISDLINQTHKKINDICNQIQQQKLLGFSHKPINTIVNIGIGGSDLGPKMVYHALQPYWNNNITCHFVSNIDPCDITNTLSQCNPETTLFIVASKSFTTSETLTNAKTARKWLLEHCQFEDLDKHFIAISSNVKKAVEFGMNDNNIFPMWDWVGGRYSLWSAIGLPIALGTSYQTFKELLNGANYIDNHFKSNSWFENIPVILALISIGYINYANCQSHAILPYSDSLEYFVNYIQQLDMESNGKSIDSDNNNIYYNTGPIIWGGVGTNGQHAFHQLLHQGSHLIPCDFIVPLSSQVTKNEQHKILVANAFAQAQTLMQGNINTKHNYKNLVGNKPSNTLLFDKLSPYTLGSLIAIYEHKVFSQGAIWNINSFDQWGVEQGKIIADAIAPYLDYNCNSSSNFDPSTNLLISKYQSYSKQQ